jgi:hypothetical protein
MQLRFYSLFLDFLQLLSLDLIKDEPTTRVEKSGQLTSALSGLRLDFGNIWNDRSLAIVVCLVGIWWLLSTFVITSVNVRQAHRAMALPGISTVVPLITNALFLTVCTVLSRWCECSCDVHLCSLYTLCARKSHNQYATLHTTVKFVACTPPYDEVSVGSEVAYLDSSCVKVDSLVGLPR